MKITRDNYEPFFLDYLEGNLDENKIDQFLEFLMQNPDLKEELHLFENVHLPEEQIIFSDKMKLYKNAADEKIVAENKAIAYLEGDLDDDDRKSFETYLATHPELQKEYTVFTKTRLIPEAGIKYPDKLKLYKKSGLTVVMKWAVRAAAVVVLLWGINSIFQNENQPTAVKSNQEIAALSPKAILPVKTVESEKKIQETENQEKFNLVNESKLLKTKRNRGQAKRRPEEKASTVLPSAERDLTVLAEITPIRSKLDLESTANRLAVSRSVNTEKINDPRNIMTVEEFLASRAKKAGNEGLLSAQRIMRLGLNVASELSGQRISYKVKGGKVSSLDFESKLMAFSIPLEKK